MRESAERMCVTVTRKQKNEKPKKLQNTKSTKNGMLVNDLSVSCPCRMIV